jgi:sec-independent protein translocase protein TatB
VLKVTRASGARSRQRGFFDFSFPEIVITFGVALVVLGPKKLPGLVAQVGRWVGRARHMARQFREQLEQEVNSINEVKPIPRHVPPAVGPVAPPEAQAASAVATETDSVESATHAEPVGGVAAGGTVEGKVDAPEPAGNDVHPEAQIYFALNGTQPEVVAENPYTATDPYTPQPEGAPEPAATPEHADATAPGEHAKPVAPSEPASVQVIFPHDHG